MRTLPYVTLLNRLVEAEKQVLPVTPTILEELVALGRAQRRALKAAHTQLQDDPLFAHLLKSRIAYYRADENRSKSGKRLEDLVRSTFFTAQSLLFRGDIDDWRKLLAIFPR
jgi:hypothetical protein